MHTFALVGKTGTGKSYHSLELARENNIEAVIDDGLLISRNKILAGSSAKHEATRIASVKRAIFLDEAHQNSVKPAIKKHGIESVLILGTSQKMVRLIADALGISPIEKFFDIEDITTPEDRQAAATMRNKFGKHIIPAPVFEVKKQFSGYFLKSLITGRRDIDPEKTIMRPTYSYMGSFKISPKVFLDICFFEVSKIQGVSEVLRVKSLPLSNGCIDISLELSLSFPCDIPKTASLVQEIVSSSIEESTSIVVSQVNVFVKSLK